MNKKILQSIVPEEKKRVFYAIECAGCHERIENCQCKGFNACRTEVIRNIEALDMEKDIQSQFIKILNLIRGAGDYSQRDEEIMSLIAKWCELEYPPLTPNKE